MMDVIAKLPWNVLVKSPNGGAVEFSQTEWASSSLEIAGEHLYRIVPESDAHRLAALDETAEGFARMYKDAHDAAALLMIENTRLKERLAKFERASQALKMADGADLQETYNQFMIEFLDAFRSAMGDK